MAAQDGEDTNVPQDPPLLRSETSDLRLTYSLEQGPPIAASVVASVETEDIPNSLETVGEIEPAIGDKVASSSAPSAVSDDEDETILLRPPAKRKALGPNASFYSGTFNFFNTYFALFILLTFHGVLLFPFQRSDI